MNAAEVPDYYTIVSDPVDLSLIARRVESGQYYVALDVRAGTERGPPLSLSAPFCGH